MKTYHAVGSKLILRDRNPLLVDESSGLKMAGDLFLPANTTLQNKEGSPFLEWKVISVGPDCKIAKKDDVVLANGHIVMQIIIDGEKLGLVDESSLIAVVKETPDALAPKAS